MIPYVGASLLFRLDDAPEGTPRYRPAVVVSTGTTPADEGGPANLLVWLDPRDPEARGALLEPVQPWTFADQAREGVGVGCWSGARAPIEGAAVSPRSVEIPTEPGCPAPADLAERRRVLGRRRG